MALQWRDGDVRSLFLVLRWKATWREAVPGVRILSHGDFIEIALQKSPSIQTRKQ
jgi:hypothetical protein